MNGDRFDNVETYSKGSNIIGTQLLIKVPIIMNVERMFFAA